MKTLCSLLVIPALMLAGCGDGIALYPVSGTVTVDGQPRGDLLVTFVPDEAGGYTGTATTGTDGTYSVRCIKGSGVPSGNYTIRITPVATAAVGADEEGEEYVSSDNAAYETQAGGSRDQYAEAAAEAAKNAIPAKYNTQTTLKEVVAESDDNKFDFALDSK